MKLVPWVLTGVLAVLLLISQQSSRSQALKAQELEQRANQLAAQVKDAKLQFEKLDQFLKDQKERNDETQAKLDAVESDHQLAEDAGARLRRELARMRDSKPSAACPPSQAASTVAPVPSAEGSQSVLADMLSQCSERREELAQFADKSRIAHASCVGDYRAAERLIEQLINRSSDK